MFKEFKAFLTRGNVVDLGVGIVIGAAFTSVVNGFVTGILNPLVALFGDLPLDQLRFGVGSEIETIDGKEEIVARTVVEYGLVLDALLHFILVGAALFFLVVRPINKFEERRKAGAPPAQPQTRACPECLSDIPLKAIRCAHCTAKVGAVT